MRRFLILILIVLPFISQAQSNELNGCIHDWNNKSLKLYSFYGDKIDLIDSVLTSDYGQFKFNLDDEYPKGIYRIGINKEYYLDIIVNNEDIDLSTHISDPFNSLSFNKSEENKIYLSYLHKRNYDQYRIELLQPVISYYPMTDAFFPTLLTEFSNIQDSLNQYIDRVTEEHPQTFASTLIAIDRRPDLNPTLNQNEQKEFAKQHFFDEKDFSDEALLNTNILTSNILSYLSLYQNSEFSKARMEDEFIKAVDIILPAMRANRKIYEFVIEYLISGFDQFGLTKVMTHIASQSIMDEACENEDLKHRISTLQKLAPGNKAPEIILGNTTLSDIKKKYTLVVFYASWCPHCNELLPQLADFYREQEQNLEILSVSIDTSKTDYQDYVKQYSFEWINECDFKGWDTKAAIDYGVYVTPNLFLLDENKKVIARPSGMLELVELIK